MKTILLILALVTGVTAAEAVTITLKSGGTMTGPLVAKSATEIKVETTYGVIALQPDMVVPESWATAQAATISKPSGKFAPPNPAAPAKLTGSGLQKTKSPYDTGISDGRIVGKLDGKHDGATGKDRDDEKAKRIGKLNSTSYPKAEDQADYARGYHEGYNKGWSQHLGYGKLTDPNGLNPIQR